MESMPDKKYGLAIVDPEYGIGISKNSFRQKHAKKNWDSKPPDNKYFNQLFKCAENQIIWGGNYFDLPPSQGFIIWDKVQPFDFSSAMCEYAWLSIQMPAKMFKKHVVTAEKYKIHPTQKPVALYKWILKNYAFNKDGSKRTIFDSHAGSMSLVIACIDLGFDIDCWEIDEDYYRDAVNRVKRYLAQQDLTREPVEINYFKD